MALFVLAGMLVFLVPRDELLKDAPDKRTWRDIRWWGVALAVTQIGIYLIFT
ncbi:MAG: hypothetical protein H6993_10960 [Pseudomonadales bacterium]|nr:hypothetical protein [Pseudomonadales bacterium]MCP5184475.1 hypothetical protein [Pseudomonadales bacterium]